MRENVKLLENMILELIDEKIEIISVDSLRCRIMEKCHVNKKETIAWYIEILEIHRWIKYYKKHKNIEPHFKISYKKDNGELF